MITNISLIFTVKDKQFNILGRTTNDITKNGLFYSKTSQIVPDANLPKALSLDEAKTQLEDFNKQVVRGQTSFEDYFNGMRSGNEILKDYVSTTDQQNQSVQGLVRASQQARDRQIAQNQSIQQGTLSFKAGQVALNGLAMAGNMVTFMLIAKGIEIAIKQLDKFVHKEQYAYEASVKNYEKAKEQTKQNLENADSLKKLIAKYEELRSSSDWAENVDSRKQVRDIQNDIASIVGTEANNLDLVNGKLSDQLNILKQISAEEAKDAVQDTTEQYYAAKDVFNRSNHEHGWLDYDVKFKGNSSKKNTAYSLLYKQYELNENKTDEEIDEELGFLIRDNGFGTKLYINAIGNNAQEKIDSLYKAADFLAENGFKDSREYSQIMAQIQLYKEDIRPMEEAGKSLLESILLDQKYNNSDLPTVNSADSLEQYRKKMLKSVIENEDIQIAISDGVLSNEYIENAVTSYLSTLTEFSNYYEGWLDKYINKTKNGRKQLSQNNLFSFNFNRLDSSGNNIIDDYQQSLETLGETYSKIINGNYSSSELIDMLQQLRAAGYDVSKMTSIEQLGDAINTLKTDNLDNLFTKLNLEPNSALADYLRNISDEAINVKSALTGVTSSLSDIQDGFSTVSKAINEYNENGFLTIETLNSILSLEPKYLSCLRSENGQLSLNESAYIELTQAQLKNAKQAVINEAITRLNNVSNMGLVTSTDAAAETEENFLDKIFKGKSILKDYCEQIYTSIKAKFNLSKATTASDIISSSIEAELENVTSEEVLTINNQRLQNAYNQIDAQYKKYADEIISDTQVKLNLIDSVENSTLKSLNSDNSGSSGQNSANSLFDFIELRLTRLKSKTQNIINQITEYTSTALKRTLLNNSINSIFEEIDAQVQAYSQYMAKAEAVVLDEYWKEKIRNGSIEINASIPEETSQALSDYQNWYEKALAAQEEINSLKTEELNKVKELAELEATIYERRINASNYTKDYLNKYISYNEAAGREIEASVYENLIDSNYEIEESLSSQLKIYKNLAKQLDSTSDAYHEIQDNIHQLTLSVLDLQQENAELIKTLKELPVKNIQYWLDYLDSIGNEYKSLSDYRKQIGASLSAKNYQDQISNNIRQLQQLEKQKKAVYSLVLYSANARNTLDELEYSKQYHELESTIYDLKAANDALKDSMRDDVYWRDFEKAHTVAEKLADNLQSLSALINDDTLIDDDGKLTKNGNVMVALYLKQYETAKEEVVNYMKDLNNAFKLKNQGLYTIDEYNEKLAELQQGLLEAADSVKSFTDSLIDLYVQQGQAEIDALSELVNLRTEALQKKKEYYDYDKTIQSKSKDIQALETQKAALEATEDTLEKRKKLLELEAQLQEKRDDLEDTKYEHEINLIVNGLDDFTQDIQDRFDTYTKNLQNSLEMQTDIINEANKMYADSYGKVQTVLDGILSSYGIDTSQTLFNTATLLGKSTNGELMSSFYKINSPNYTISNPIAAGNVINCDVTFDFKTDNTSVQDFEQMIPEITDKVSTQLAQNLKKIGY